MFRLVVTLPKRVKRVLPSTRWYIDTMEAARYETREGLGGADRSADATRDMLRHLGAAVRAEEVAAKTFEFCGNRYLLTPDGLGARRWNKSGAKWEKTVRVLTDCNEDFQAAAKGATQ